jgi:hypothetical protein
VERFAEGSPLQHASHVRICLYSRDFDLTEEDVMWQIGLRRYLRVNNDITDLAHAEWTVESKTKIPSPLEVEFDSLAGEGELPSLIGPFTTATAITVSSDGQSALSETVRTEKFAMDPKSLGVAVRQEPSDAQEPEEKRLEAKKSLKQVEDATSSLISSSQFSSISRRSSCSSPGDGK